MFRHGEADVDPTILAGAKAFHRDAQLRLQQVTNEQLEVDRRQGPKVVMRSSLSGRGQAVHM